MWVLLAPFVIAYHVRTKELTIIIVLLTENLGVANGLG